MDIASNTDDFDVDGIDIYLMSDFYLYGIVYAKKWNDRRVYRKLTFHEANFQYSIGDNARSK